MFHPWDKVWYTYCQYITQKNSDIAMLLVVTKEEYLWIKQTFLEMKLKMHVSGIQVVAFQSEINV